MQPDRRQWEARVPTQLAARKLQLEARSEEFGRLGLQDGSLGPARLSGPESRPRSIILANI